VSRVVLMLFLALAPSALRAQSPEAGEVRTNPKDALVCAYLPQERRAPRSRRAGQWPLQDAARRVVVS